MSRSFWWWMIALTALLALGVWLFALGWGSVPFANPLSTSM